MSKYQDFLRNKARVVSIEGIPGPYDLPAALFPFQRDIVSWALRKGRAAIFADCGLGKTPMQLAWAHQVAKYTGERVLILAPLAVSRQTHGEGEKFNLPVQIVRSQSEVTESVVVTNYEMLEHMRAEDFGGIVLDESSILKAFDGKTRTRIIESFSSVKFRLACTATPAPNDFMELGNHSEFLGVLSRTEMLAEFFVHDGGETQKWRLKGHAEAEFWKWVCEWAVAMRKPSDLGYEDDGFNLPAMNIVHHITANDDEAAHKAGRLFAFEAHTLDERRAARRGSTDDRVERASNLVSSNAGPWIVWVDFNVEGNAATKSIPGSIQISGSDTREEKERKIGWFIGEICLCKDSSSRAKLAECGRGNITRIAGEDTLPIRSTHRGDGSNLDQASSISSICGNTIEPTARSLSELANNKIKSTQTAGEDTPSTHNSENSAELSQEQETKIVYGMVCSENPTELGSRTTIESLSLKAEDVQSAEILNAKIKSSAGCTSIIATKPEPYEGSSAHPVTLVSGSLVTMPIACDAPRCMCGHISGNRVLVSKPSIFAWGMNFQFCSQMVFVGLSDSYEAFYQAIRRCWRFGQKNEVAVHIITSGAESAIVKNIQRKEAAAVSMANAMVKHMSARSAEAIRGREISVALDQKIESESGENWTVYLGDCIETMRVIPDDSIHYSIFSPPFASLYTYSSSERDLGNTRTDEEFAEHFGFLIPELYRALMPGRLCSVHCMNLPTSKVRDGVIGIRDFRGEIIRSFVAAGWIYHSEVVIWKDPVTSMQRTKALGLLHKQLKKDSCMSRQGIPDYVVTFRKPGDNPERVTHTNESFPVSLWQRYASPIWMDINATRTLQKDSAREEKDERHICPLQLDVIERCVDLWTNSGDIVLSPFAGIGSEGVVAVERGRRFAGIELKRSYFNQAVANLKLAEARVASQGNLFDSPRELQTTQTQQRHGAGGDDERIG